jgi:YfiH family protein
MPYRDYLKNHLFNFAPFFGEDVLAFTTDASVDFPLSTSAPFLNASQRDFLREQAQLSWSKVFNIRQVHGSKVIVATAKAYKESNVIIQADGIVTKDCDVPIAIRTADCLPVFIYDPKQKVIGITHAGWRSTQKRIVQGTLKKMKSKFKTRVQDVKVALGPGLRFCCYEVTEEFLKSFPKETKHKGDHLYFDLALANRHQLLSLGVFSRNIFDSKICTFCTKKCFSFRRDQERAGRMLSVMMLKS